MQPFYNRSAPSVSDIKAKFEAKRDKPSSSSPTRQQQPQPQKQDVVVADMTSSLSKRPATRQAQQPSIDTVIDRVPANAVSPAAIRPHSSKQPSWVGPKPPGRNKTPSIAAMKQAVTITFSSPGLRPPVFISTDLTDPQWEPVEMGGEENEQGEWTFTKGFVVEEGEYQYKLRLGPGDWWVCDDSCPKLDDGAGNENNLVVVSAPEVNAPEQKPLDKVDSAMGASLPLPSDTEHHDAPGPLLSHETLAPPSAPQTDSSHDDEPDDTPLLRHESIKPSSHEQNHSPLFRHESMAIDDKHHDELHYRLPSDRKSSSDSIPAEADPNDPSLEPFPTDHKGIMEHLDRTRSSMQADETSHEPGSPAQSVSSANSAVMSASPSLPSVREDEDGELEHLREDANAEAEAEAEKEGNMAPNADIPALRIIEVDIEAPDRPAAPITPPDTPKKGDDDDREIVDSPMSSRMTAEQLKRMIKEKKAALRAQVQERTEQAKRSALPGMLLLLSIAVAFASAGIGWWYFKTGGDKIVADV